MAGYTIDLTVSSNTVIYGNTFIGTLTDSLDWVRDLYGRLSSLMSLPPPLVRESFLIGAQGQYDRVERSVYIDRRCPDGFKRWVAFHEFAHHVAILAGDDGSHANMFYASLAQILTTARETVEPFFLAFESSYGEGDAPKVLFDAFGYQWKKYDATETSQPVRRKIIWSG